MLAPENNVVATIMLLGTMMCWGSWSSIRMKCNADGPVFVVIYILAQFATGCLLAFTLGMGTGVDGLFDSRTFVGGMSHPGAWYRILAIIVGGSACANSDFLASCAMSRLPFSVVVPVFMGWSLIQATVLNYFIENSDTDPYFLFSGIFIALLAILSMALSDVYGARGSPADHENVRDLYRSISRGDSRRVDGTSSSLHDPILADILQSSGNGGSIKESETKGNDSGDPTAARRGINAWLYVSIFSGFLAGIWSPLQVFGRAGSNAVDNPSIILFFFQLGEVLSIPFILYYHGRVIVVVESGEKPVSPGVYISKALSLPLRDKVYGSLAGSTVACGTYVFFTASEVIPSTVAFAISSCAPLVTIALGIFLFHQLRGASFLQTFFIVLATVLFILAIILMVLADYY